MAHENLTYEDLLRIVQLIKSSERFSEFRLKVGEIEVELKRRNGTGSAVQSPPPAQAASEPSMAHQAGDSQASERPALPAREKPPAASWPTDGVVVRAPTMGTFYRAPAPGAPPFVTIGQRVEAETTVCIIEVMKLMSSIPAGARGVVTHILVDDGQPVDAHAPLIVLDPTP